MRSIREHLTEMMGELPQAVLLAVLTAVATLTLMLAVSAVLGTENAEHRNATRCFAHDTTALIREIVLASDSLRERIDLTRYPPIDIAGLDCAAIYEMLEGEQ